MAERSTAVERKRDIGLRFGFLPLSPLPLLFLLVLCCVCVCVCMCVCMCLCVCVCVCLSLSLHLLLFRSVFHRSSSFSLSSSLLSPFLSLVHGLKKERDFSTGASVTIAILSLAPLRKGEAAEVTSSLLSSRLLLTRGLFEPQTHFTHTHSHIHSQTKHTPT